MDRIGGDETLLRIDVHWGFFSRIKCRANRGGFIHERLALLGHLYMRISWEVLLWNDLAWVNWSSSKFVIYKLFSFFWHESVRHWNTLDSRSLITLNLQRFRDHVIRVRASRCTGKALEDRSITTCTSNSAACAFWHPIANAMYKDGIYVQLQIRMQDAVILLFIFLSISATSLDT